MRVLQEIEAQRDKLGRVQQDAEKAEEKFRMEKERLMDKAERTEMQYQRAKAEKEGVELNLMKLTRDLENLQHEHKELRELRGVEETRTRSERSDNQRIAMELEDLHRKYDRAQLEIKQLAEDKDKFEVESRKFRNQLDHARASLAAAVSAAASVSGRLAPGERLVSMVSPVATPPKPPPLVRGSRWLLARAALPMGWPFASLGSARPHRAWSGARMAGPRAITGSPS